MLERCGRTAPWLSVLGALSLVTGMAWDVAVHRFTPGLAAQESPFSLANPAHFLITLGAALAVLGAAGFLLGRAAGWRQHGWRRRAAAAMPLAVLLAVSALAAAVALGEGTGAVHEHGVPVAVTQQELEAAAKLVSDVRRGTQRLADFGVAVAEGYRQITPARLGAAHYFNPAYHRDGRLLDAERPETLVYLAQRDGTKRLIGVMFLMPPGQPGPRIGGALTAWHAHEGLCFSGTTGMLTGVAGRGGACNGGDIQQARTGDMLHVWLEDNPNGVFAERLPLATLVRLRLQRSNGAE